MRPDDRVAQPGLGRRAPAAWSGQSAAATPPSASVPLLDRNLDRFRKHQTPASANEQWSWAIVGLAVAAVAYNGLLAILNAHGMTVGRNHVILSELLILAGGGVVILSTGPRSGDGAPAALLAFFFLDALVVSLLNSDLFVDFARNAAIVTVFMMLGARIDSKHLNRCFTIAAIIVFAVLLLEMLSVDDYAKLFAPADYFANTRGIAKQNFDQMGLFANALGFDSRFAILTLMDHRACSIFLEQVSLANFGIVLTMVLACNWRQLSLPNAAFFAGLILLIVVTTASRRALGLILLTPVAVLLSSRLNRNLTLLVMPLTVVIAAFVAMNSSGVYSDDLPGRLTKTVQALGTLDADAVSGLRAMSAAGFADSGYVYVIYASTIFGMLALWLFVSLILAENKPKLLRCSLLLNLYIFCSLTVSGNSVFSMKTAALLWLLVGNVRSGVEAEEPATAEQPLRAKLASV
jgi:hypothetical protein